MNMNKKIRDVYETSVEVFKKCSLKNGAIVASDVNDPDYPEGVKSYNYVWPRDASFVCVACDLVGLHRIPEKFFEWCSRYPPDFRQKGVFSMRYRADGRLYGKQFQPDQTASLLWAIHSHSKHRNVKKYGDVIKKAADGICNSWLGTCFRRSYDIWEENVASPRKGQNHTYSLAMCIKGLRCACEIVKPEDRWLIVINQMLEKLERAYDGKSRFFVRTYGSSDRRVDSSMLGLVWPADVISAKDKRMVSTVQRIIKDNSVESGGIMRYKGDMYDGTLKRRGGGAWPVLNFWLSIYYTLAGDRPKAFRYFNWVLDRVEKKLPEQIIDGRPGSVIPLAWSHAMFVIAGKFLKLF
jgi:GH15 family glucan-1,4-alpha-glucosidase